MNHFDILPDTDNIQIKASGGTRAGLLTAALKGMFYAGGPHEIAGAVDVEREFALKADDFSALLFDFLSQAVTFGQEYKELYDSIRFTLITDKEAKGAFMGRAVAGFVKPVKAVSKDGLSVEKMPLGHWEAKIAFDI